MSKTVSYRKRDSWLCTLFEIIETRGKERSIDAACSPREMGYLECVYLLRRHTYKSSSGTEDLSYVCPFSQKSTQSR